MERLVTTKFVVMAVGLSALEMFIPLKRHWYVIGNALIAWTEKLVMGLAPANGSGFVPTSLLKGWRTIWSGTIAVQFVGSLPYSESAMRVSAPPPPSAYVGHGDV